MAEEEKDTTMPPRSHTHGSKDEHKFTFFNKKGKKEIPADVIQQSLSVEGQTLGRRSVPAETSPVETLRETLRETSREASVEAPVETSTEVIATEATPTAVTPVAPATRPIEPTAIVPQTNAPAVRRTERTTPESPYPVPSRSARHGGASNKPAAALPPGATPGGPAAPFQKPSPLVMLVIILAVFMAILDTSIVNVSLPKMMAVFGVGTTDIQWVLTAYTLVVGALIPVTGYLGDRFGYRKMFIISLAVFTIGSGLCGAAWSNQAMIMFRILQAIGGGALMPVSMAMIFRMFPPERRGAAMGMFGIAIMFAPAIGPTLSGYITEYLNWRLIFYINVPFGILDFFLALAVLKEIGTPTERRFDLWGFLTSTIGFSTLLYGLGIVADKGWGDTEVISYLTVAIVSLVSFIIIELSVKEPMLDLRLLKHFQFTLSLLISSIASVVLFGTLFLLPVFLQNISGLSAIQTGLLLLPQALITGVMMPIAGALYDRFGARWLAASGLLITAYSLYLTHNLDVNTPFSTLIGWLIIRAIGIGLMMMPVQTAGMDAIPVRSVGQGTAISNTVRQVAASFGIAWLTLLLSHRETFHVSANAAQYSIFSPNTTSVISHLQAAFASLGPSGSKAMAIGMLSGKVQMISVVEAMDDVFYVLTWIALAAIIFAVMIRRVKRQGGKKGHAPMME